MKSELFESATGPAREARGQQVRRWGFVQWKGTMASAGGSRTRSAKEARSQAPSWGGVTAYGRAGERHAVFGRPESTISCASIATSAGELRYEAVPTAAKRQRQTRSTTQQQLEQQAVRSGIQ